MQFIKTSVCKPVTKFGRPKSVTNFCQSLKKTTAIIHRCRISYIIYYYYYYLLPYSLIRGPKAIQLTHRLELLNIHDQRPSFASNPVNVVNCPRTTIFPSALLCSRNTITMSSWIEFLTLKSVLARHRCDIHQFLCISVGNFGMMCKLRHVSKEGILLNGLPFT